MNYKRVLGWIVVLGQLCHLAIAQDKPLDIEQAGIQPTIQPGRPILSWWDVKIRGSGLVEGRFEFQIKNDDRLLATATTEDLALTGPQQRIRVMLPPVLDQLPIDQLQLDIKFSGTRFSQALGRQTLRVASSKSRSFMVLTGTSRFASMRSPDRDELARRLAFEFLLANGEEVCRTINVPLEPVDFPQEPIGYCSYELVVLHDEEFRQLKPGHLDALASWVRAGGSLYVAPRGILEPYHVEFLRSLVVFDPRELVIQPDSSGRLIPGTVWNDERLLMLSNGLGRVVLWIDEKPPENLDTPPWREATAFLWRIHRDQTQAIAERGQPNLSSLMFNRPNPANEYTVNTSVTFIHRLGKKLLTSTVELVNWLMPEGVRMVPLWVLTLILSIFVILIGPVDYFVLGRLRARKFTWVTFPLATILVTVLTVVITNRYMSTSETRRGLVIHDLGDDGQVVRVNRFELLFIASTRTVTTDIRKGIFTALTTGRSLEDDSFAPQRFPQPRRRGFGSQGELGIDRPPPRISGRIPTEFTVSQDLAKWTPQLNRVISIPGANESPQVDWPTFLEGVNLNGMLGNRVVPVELESRIVEKFGPLAKVAFLASDGRWARSHNQTWQSLNSSDPQSTRSYGYSPYGDMYQWSMPTEIAGQPDLFRWLYQHSVAAPYGLFTLTYQVGPTGSSDLNDLPILDSSDPRRALMIVVVPKGDDFIVYRKLMAVNP